VISTWCFENGVTRGAAAARTRAVDYDSLDDHHM